MGQSMGLERQSLRRAECASIVNTDKQRSTKGKKDWIKEIGPRREDWKVSCQISGAIVSTGPVGNGNDALKINPAR